MRSPPVAFATVRMVFLVSFWAGLFVSFWPGAPGALAPAMAWAQAADDSAAIGKLTLLNRQAIEAFRRGAVDDAQRLLDEALDLASAAGLSQHPLRARSYVNLGVVTAAGLKRRDVAVRLFQKGLQIQPEIQPSPELATPEVRSAFDEAIRGLGAAAPAPRSAEPASDLLVHEAVATAARGEAITVAATPDDSLRAGRLVLAYRASGGLAFVKTNMQRQADGVFEGVIPSAATGGRDVAYYLEARDADDRVVATRGSATAPLTITVTAPPPSPPSPPSLPPSPAGPTAAAAAPGSQPVAGPALGGRSAAETPRPAEAGVLLGLLLGSGIGRTGGLGEATGYDVGGAKVAWSRLVHVAPEIGIFVLPQLLLGLEARLQLVTGGGEYRTPDAEVAQCGGDGVCSPARAAFAGFAKATWFFTPPDRALRPYVSLSIGGGHVRQVVELTSPNGDCGADRRQSTCRDTVAAGPLLLGPGVGLHYDLGSRTLLVLAFQALMSAPRVGLGVDANVGVARLF